MQIAHDRAFKEWAVACEALRDGKQLLLIRKGGIREEGGVFQINDREFFLLPTYEHQKANLLQPEYVPRLEAIQAKPLDFENVTLDSYAVVDTIVVAKDEEQVNALVEEFPWNAAYVSDRFAFNPYDPLYLVVLRVYRLPEPITIPMRPDYIGCKSWVTLEQSVSTQGATPALPDAEFARRREAILDHLKGR